MIPAAVTVVAAVRRRAGWARTVAPVLLLLALVGVSGVAAGYGLLSFDASY